MSKDLTTITSALLKVEIKSESDSLQLELTILSFRGLLTNMFVDESRSNPLSKTMINLRWARLLALECWLTRIVAAKTITTKQ